jgi:hypothetical protein
MLNTAIACRCLRERKPANKSEVRHEGRIVREREETPNEYLAGGRMMVISVVSIIEVRCFFCTKDLKDFFRGSSG